MRVHLLLVALSLFISTSALSTTFSAVSKTADDGDDLDFGNVNDIIAADIYVATLTINGHDFEVSPFET